MAYWCLDGWKNLLMFVLVKLSIPCKCMIWFILILFAVDAVNFIYSVFICDEYSSRKMIASFHYTCKIETIVMREFDWNFFLMYFRDIYSHCISAKKMIISRNSSNPYTGVSVFDVFAKDKKTKCIPNPFITKMQWMLCLYPIMCYKPCAFIWAFVTIKLRWVWKTVRTRLTFDGYSCNR